MGSGRQMTKPRRIDMNSVAVQHTIRFRKVSNRYPLRVTEAYLGNQEEASRDDDATVAERVRQWEIAHGIEPRDWVKIGQVDEGREDD